MSHIYNLDADNKDAIVRSCASSFLKGFVAVIPTDTVYGISADYFNKKARQRIVAIKDRPLSKSFIVLVKDIGALLDFARQDIPKPVLNLLPAKLTLVVKNRHVACYGEDTIALRIPLYSFLIDLLSFLDKPLISTSFNYKGSIENALYKDFKAKIDFCVLNKTISQDTSPSTILDISKKPYSIIRQGAYKVPSHIFASS